MSGNLTFLPAGVHYDIPAERYHRADLTAEPALSAGAIIKLIKCGPAAAWVYANEPTPPSSGLEFGTAAHIAFLEGHRFPEAVECIDAKDYKTKAAREARDAAREAGKTPLLPSDVKRLEEMGRAMRNELGVPFKTAAPFLSEIFQDGHGEVTAISGAQPWLKVRPDYVHEGEGTDILVDYKTSGMKDRIDWQANDARWDLRAAFYRRVWKEATGKEAVYIYVRQSTDYPFIVRYAMFEETDLALASAEVNDGIALWQQCKRQGEWPSYVEAPHILKIRRR